MDRPKRIAFAVAAALIAIGAVGCTQNASTPGDAALSIVPQKPVDQNGNEVKLESGGAPLDPAGDGKATCPPVSPQSTASRKSPA